MVTYVVTHTHAHAHAHVHTHTYIMRNSYRYLREGFSGKYLALYVIMENGLFVIIVNYTLYIQTQI